MAIKIRRRTTTPQKPKVLGVKKAKLTLTTPDGDEQTLLEVGLSQEALETPEPPKYPFWSVCGSPQKDGPALSEGDRIVIVNDIYTWMESWQGGDTGVITKVWQPTREASKHYGMGVIEVQLDKPRTKDRVMLHWRDVVLEEVDAS